MTRHGKTTVQYFGAPTFRQTRRGWVRLSGRLRHQRGAFALTASGMAVPTSFGSRASSLVRLQTASGVVTWGLVGGRNVRPRLMRAGHRRVVVYRNIRSGVDLIYAVSGSRLKESLRIRSRSAAHSFRFTIHDPHHVLGSITHGKRGAAGFTGWVGDGLKVALAAPSATAGVGLKNGVPGDGSARQKVRRTRSGYSLRLGLSKAWAAKHKFPVMLDPSLSYTWAGGTLSSAFAPVRPDACSGDPCPLASSEDGLAFVAEWSGVFDWDTSTYTSDEYGPIDAMFHADLSTIPAWEDIDSATFGFETDPDAQFDSYCSNNFFGLRSVLADPQPGDSFQSAITGSTEDQPGSVDDIGSAVDGGERYESDITGAVNDWLRNGNGTLASLDLNRYTVCDRRANPDPPAGVEEPENFGWIDDPSLTITYTGAQLPPPIPVKQSLGCSCAWHHGPDLQSPAADPVNTAVGDATETVTDVSTPGAGVPFAFTRTYNGADTTDGPLGVGWSVREGASLTVDSGYGDVTFTDPSGGQVVFHQQLDGTYIGAAGATSDLESVSGGWTLTSLKGEVLTFDSAGEETSDTDTAGRGLSLAYTGTGTSRRLATVTDAAGRTATLGWGSSGPAAGKIVSVTTDDGREVDYGYTTVNGGPHLTSVTAPDGKQTSLSYDATTGELDGVTSPGSNTSAQNTYDAQGRVTSQTDADGNVTHFSWAPAGGANASLYPAGSGTETTNDANGNTTKDLYYGNVLLKQTDAYGDTTSYTYDDNLDVTSITDARGYVTTMTYDSAGNMLTRTAPAPLSYEEQWTYNAANEVTSYTNGRGKTWTYIYDSVGERLSATDPLGHTTTMTYTTGGQLATVTTPEGRETSYGYDTAGNKTSMIDGAGDQTTWSYDDAGRVISTTDPRGNTPGATASDFTTTYTYDDAGRPLTTTTPNGAVTTDSYDDDGNLAEETVIHGSGGSTTTLSDVAYTHDANGNALVTTAFPGTAAERVTDTDTYDPDGNLASSTDADGGLTVYSYDALNRLSTKISPNGNATGENYNHYTSYYYDEVGNPTGVDGPGTHPTSTDYDALNRPVTTRDGEYRVTNTTYDPAGEKTSATDADGDQTTWTYDDAGRLTGMALPDKDATLYTYDDDGDRLTATSPSGDSQTSWTYDDAGRLDSQTDPRGHVTGGLAADYTSHTGYDPAGNRTSQTDELGHETEWSYDAQNNQTGQTDANGHRTAWTYDRLDRITEVDPPGPAGGGGGLGGGGTTYSYDDYGNLTALTNGRGKTTSYGYDDLDRLTSVTDPLGREKTYAYDADGNLTSYITARGHTSGATATDYTVTQTFNGAGDLTSRTTPDGTADASYGYDQSGLLDTVTDPTGTTTLTYDNAARLAGVDGPTGTYSYTHTSAGQVASRTYPNGDEIDYSYNADNLPTSLTTTSPSSTGGSAHTVSLDYNADQRLTTISYPALANGGPGVTETRSYDRGGQISQVTNTQEASGGGPASLLSQYDYTRDPVGNPTQVERTRGTSVHDDAYTYNARDWLTKQCPNVTSCTGTSDYISYAYDDDGNRTTMDRVNSGSGAVSDPGVTSYTYDDADQLTDTTTTPSGGSAATSIDTYDADGNLTTDDRTWNVLNQLTSSNVGGITATYAYDGLGNRTAVTTNTGPSASAVTRAYSWDINNPLPMLAVITNPDTGTGSTTDTQTYAPDGTLLSSTHPDEAYDTDYYTHDALGSLVDDLQGDGTLLTQTAYDPYGNTDPTGTTTVTAGAVDVRFGYTGANTEPATTDIALRARDYNPATGRFTATDPLPGTPQQPNPDPYLYAGNNPTRHVDPSGKSEGLPGEGGEAGPTIISIEVEQAELEASVASNHPDLDTSSPSQAELKALQKADYEASTGGEPATAASTCAETGAAKSADELAHLGQGWRATSFGDEAASFEYHFGKHGVEAGVTREQYAQDALNWARNPAGTGKLIQLKDGTEGLRYRTPGGGPGGITDLDGNIITFWYR